MNNINVLQAMFYWLHLENVVMDFSIISVKVNVLQEFQGDCHENSSWGLRPHTPYFAL